jgi:Calx-beta domain
MLHIMSGRFLAIWACFLALSVAAAQDTVTVTAGVASAYEQGLIPGSFVFIRTDTTGQLDVSYTVSGTATLDTDYSLLNGADNSPLLGKVTFLSGSNTAVVTVSPLGTDLSAGSLNVILTINTSSNYSVGSPGSASVRLAEVPPRDTVTVTSGVATAYEQGLIPGSFIFTRTGTSGPLSVSYTVGGTATPLADYLPLSGTVTFASGSNTAVVTVSPIANQKATGALNVNLQIVDNNSTYNIGAASSATVALADMDIEARMTAPNPVAAAFTQSAGFSPSALIECSNQHFALQQASTSTSPAGTFRSIPRTISVAIGGTAKNDGSEYNFVWDTSPGENLVAAVPTGQTSFDVSNGSNISSYVNGIGATVATFVTPSNYVDMRGHLAVPDLVSVTNVRGFYYVSNYVLHSGTNYTVSLSGDLTTPRSTTNGAGLAQAAAPQSEVRRTVYAVSNTPSSGAARGESSVILSDTTLAIGSTLQLAGAYDVPQYTTYTISAKDATNPHSYTITPALVENVPFGSDYICSTTTGTSMGTVGASSTALTGKTAAGSTTVEFDNATGVFKVGDWVAVYGVEGIYKISAINNTVMTFTSGVAKDFDNLTPLIRVGADASGFSRLDIKDNSGAVSDVDFFVFPFKDSTPQISKTVTVSMIATPHYQLITPTVSTVTIAKDDVQAGISFGNNAGQPATSGTAVITLSSPLPQAVTVPFQIGGTAELGVDYTMPGVDPTTGIGSVTIPAGSTSATLTISPSGNPNHIAGGVTVSITLLQSLDYLLVGTGTSGSNPSATINIADKQGTASVAVQSALAMEGTSPATLVSPVVRFSLLDANGNLKTPSQDLGLTYTVSGTAVAGVNYTALSGNVIISHSGPGYTDLTIPILDDVVVDPGLSIVINLQGGAGYDVSPTGSTASISITDDEPTISIAKTVDASEAGTHGIFTVSYPGVPLGTALNRPVTVNYTVAAASTAVPGTNYSALSGQVIIPANSLSATIDVTAIDDKIVNPGKTVIVNLGSTTTSYYVDGQHNTATMTIVDVAPTISIVRTTDPAETGTVGVFTVSYPGPALTYPMVVSYTVDPTSTAKPGVHYQPLSGTVTIPANSVSAPINVVAIDDQISNPGETVTVDLVASPSYSLGSSKSATVTIIDNEPTVSIALTTTASEPSTNGLFTVTASAPVTVTPMIVSYTVSGTAAAGVRYVALPGTLTIPVGQTTATIPVTIIDDKIANPGQTVIVTLAGTGGSATMILGDDDSSLVALSTNTISVNEGDTASITVVRSGGSSGAASVQVVSVDGTAIAGVHYQALSAPVTWADGEIGPKTVPLRTNRVFNMGGDKNLQVGLVSPAGTGVSLGALAVATVTITDLHLDPSSSGCGGGAGIFLLGAFVCLMLRRFRG